MIYTLKHFALFFLVIFCCFVMGYQDDTIREQRNLIRSMVQDGCLAPSNARIAKPR